MARPKNHSRLITVGERQFRWHLSVNYDYPCEKVVSVLPAEDPNGACLEMKTCAMTVSPSLVARLIFTGLKLGYDPDDRTTSLTLPAAHLNEILHDYPRPIVLGGIPYTWTPESHGGLHIKVRRSDTPTGQLLATNVTLEPDDLNEQFVAKLIETALAEGWLPGESGLDCHWLDARTCYSILANMESQRKQAR